MVALSGLPAPSGGRSPVWIKRVLCTHTENFRFRGWESLAPKRTERIRHLGMDHSYYLHALLGPLAVMSA